MCCRRIRKGGIMNLPYSNSARMVKNSLSLLNIIEVQQLLHARFLLRAEMITLLFFLYFTVLRAPFFRDRVKGGTWSKNDYPHISLKDTPWRVNKHRITFLLRSTLVLQKIRKKLYKMDISAPSINTRTLLLKSTKASRSFLFVCLCGRYWQII